MPKEPDYWTKSNEQARAVVKEFSAWVNGMDHKNAAFVEAVIQEHRTLQQQMFEVMLACMEAWAKQEHFDARNEFTVSKCREIIEHFPAGAHTPFI